MGVGQLPTTEFNDEELDEYPESHLGPVPRPGGEDMIQLLDAEGRRHDHPVFGAYAEALDAEKLRGFYRDMAVVRRFDQEATALQRQGQLALWVPLTGQEAAQIGSGHATLPEDFIFPTYREHGVALTRGMDLAQLLSLFRGVSHGGWDPREKNFNVYTLVLAAQVLHAVGYAMGIQRDRKAALARGEQPEDAAVVAYYGDGASSEGDVHESMVFAASYQAPVVFFCQNNHWAISVPTVTQTKVPLAHRAQGYGFPGIRVDGNDVLAVHAVTQWALDRARRGEGPVLIEAFTYRLGAHTTADDPTKYRPGSEEEQWRAKDPLTRLEAYLKAEGLADEAFFDDVARQGQELADHVRETVLALQAPTLEEAFQHVYAQAHPLVQEELRWYQEYEAGFVTEQQSAEG
ncbi:MULTISPECIES: pyruvate dehydrogenase (acetyl-transferring) E1 component subunit alpha [Arthrobacter]|uniref:Pyruvate dehydrogenase (Acetyl-transferring) E1 component subunit alpha n=2 Tax=Arthrobacter TaxID=1663 RepID=A0ABU9KJ63_9MICC|nr:pyruvate dehydrogenase (acetyl-transferring) E1 component subunit alpha [Arthrobacter sp. YJM1]MDP5226816.1 pyruvate dehydrogenase (acetyl-transferring) E1 component subunit alpha [Arthrobacter sp. YJM1]